MQVSRARIISFILSATFLIASAVTYSSFIKPSYDSLMKIRGEFEAKNSFFTTEKTYITRAQTLLSQYQSAQDFQASLESVLPSAPDTSDAVAQISGIAGLTGVTLTNFSSRVLEVQPLREEFLSGVGVVELVVQVSGSYDSLKKFIDHLETNMRLMNIKDAVLAQEGVGRGESLSARFVIRTYYQAQ